MGPAAASLAVSQLAVLLCTATESATTPRAAACLGVKPKNVDRVAASHVASLSAVRPPAVALAVCPAAASLPVADHFTKVSPSPHNIIC